MVKGDGGTAVVVEGFGKPRKLWQPSLLRLLDLPPFPSDFTPSPFRLGMVVLPSLAVLPLAIFISFKGPHLNGG